MIGQLGLRGISVLESSGDTGVGAPCQSNDGKMTPQFTPQFPGTCPYITAVGGTQSINPEVAWVAGSGGFSNYFTRPNYQQSAVSTYFQKYISPATLAYFKPFFNRQGRAFPDVSAHSLTPEYVPPVSAPNTQQNASLIYHLLATPSSPTTKPPSQAAPPPPAPSSPPSSPSSTMPA